MILRRYRGSGGRRCGNASRLLMQCSLLHCCTETDVEPSAAEPLSTHISIVHSNLKNPLMSIILEICSTISCLNTSLELWTRFLLCLSYRLLRLHLLYFQKESEFSATVAHMPAHPAKLVLTFFF